MLQFEICNKQFSFYDLVHISELVFTYV